MEEYGQLCYHIVKDVYGTFLAQIFRLLTKLGRLSIHQLAQKCQLPLRQVKSGVAALSQLRLIYHHTSSEGTSTYQANLDVAYNLVRTGKLLQLIHSRLGVSAVRVAEQLAAMSHASSAELEAHILRDAGRSRPENGVPAPNGHPNAMGSFSSHEHDTDSVRASIVQLAESGFIASVREAHFQTPFDVRQDAERGLRAQGLLPSGTAKKIRQIADEKIDVEVEKRLDTTISAASLSSELEGSSTSEQSVLCLDYTNLILSIRTGKITETVEKMFGKYSARVAQAACLQIGVASRHLGVQLSSDSIESTQRLDIPQISKFVAEAAGPNQGRRDHSWASQGRLVNGQHSSRANGTAGDERAVDDQLATLAEGPFSFIKQNPVTEAWSGDRVEQSNFLRDRELLRLMGEGLEGPALRIIRILADRGKLDEKTMQDTGLLGAKELRRSLAQLHKLGYLELQEVPKDPQRQPNRTIFLWFFDPERVRKVFLDKLYKTMSRLLQRQHFERDSIASTLSKVERLDVQGSEEDLLSPGELQVLYHWRQQEAWFMTELHRLDDSITILRDT